MNYKVTIGLETHVQLKTKSKVFCGCPNEFGSAPNTNVCPVCLGYPGALPVLNEEAIRFTVLTGLMLGCRINHYSKFDRKSYFYPDMPKNYQISQYDQPFCSGGKVTIELDGRTKEIRLNRIHLEEDVGKNTHLEGGSLIDFNRAGTPLMEIVSEPDMETPEEAFAYLIALKQILIYGGVSDCNLEQGNMRCDINCSIRPEGQEQLGTKTEIKNMNTFKGVYRALKAEIARQIAAVNNGEKIRQETRRWDDVAGMTVAMRTKEYAHDYRYFPDPDLLPVELSDTQIDEIKSKLPELPQARRRRLNEQYQIPDYDAGVLVADKDVADYYEEAAQLSGNAKATANWIMTEILRELSEREIGIQAIRLRPPHLAELIKLVDAKTINMTSAKEVLQHILEHGGTPGQVVKEKGLVQVSDSGAIEAFADQVIASNEKSVTDYRNGKEAAIKFLVGQVMRLSSGKANPQMALEILKKKLG